MGAADTAGVPAPSAPLDPLRPIDLRPVELAEAAVLAGITLAFCLVGWFFPGATGVTTLGALPMAVLAYRRRPRAVVASAVAGCAVGFLVVGTGPIFSVLGCALVGGTAGYARRRHWGLLRTLLVGMVIGPAVAVITDLLLLVFSASRKLTLDQVRHVWQGVASFLHGIPGLSGLVPVGNHVVDWALRWWWLTIGVGEVLGLLVGLAVAWWFAQPIIERLAWIDVTPLGLGVESAIRADAESRPDRGAVGSAPGPVPVQLRDIRVRYPGAARDALAGVDMRLAEREFVAVVGPNGSGKSTLVRILAGAAPTGGAVDRPGSAGLGAAGGTAIVFQRPESQVLGVRVADDVVWGLPVDSAVDVDDLLATVGLGGMKWRDTSGLSGGELQRLAVAAALARRPRLLLSDEATAMVDADGRADLTALLARLPDERGVTAVHVTHRREEAARAQRVVTLRDGVVVEGAPATTSAAPAPLVVPYAPAAPGSLVAPTNGVSPSRNGDRRTTAGSSGLLEVAGVTHVWAPGSPWEQRALGPVDLRVEAGSGLLVVGPNGSGKSTLAWVLAGVLRPTRGRCLLDGQPIDEHVGDVGLAFQHARLQLQRPTVRGDVRSAGDVDRRGAERALADVGLDPAFGERHIDELSGGQQRRVALAGLLARRPRVLVLDEPLAGLDEDSARDLLAVLRRLRETHDTTLVVVSHDLEGTETLCERVVELDGGRVVADRPLAASGMAGARP